MTGITRCSGMICRTSCRAGLSRGRARGVADAPRSTSRGMNDLSPKDHPELFERARTLLECDSVEITYVGGIYFLMECHQRRSEGEWFRGSGGAQEPVNFDYLSRLVVASGPTLEALMADVEAYVKLRGLPHNEAMAEIIRRQGGPEELAEAYRGQKFFRD